MTKKRHKIRVATFAVSVLVASNIFFVTQIAELEQDVAKLKKQEIRLQNKYEDKAKSYKNLEVELNKLQNENEVLRNANETLKSEKLEIEKQKKVIEEEKKNTTSRGGGSGVGLGMFEATAYCGCSICNGKWTGYPTKSGVMAKAGRTIAVDPNVIKLGTKVSVGGKIYIAEDTGSAIKGRIIDIYFDSHAEAVEFGRRQVKVTIIK